MTELRETVDVLVVGGGTAGPVAALQAARAGATVALVEQRDALGGTLSVGGVCAPQYFAAGRRQVIAGIGWELVAATLRLMDLPLPDFAETDPGRPGRTLYINPHLYALLAEEACLQAGVALHYNECPIAVAPRGDGGGWRVETAGSRTRRVIEATELIDCTGDAAVVELAGGPVTRPAQRQPGTLMFGLSGYDPETLDMELIQAKYLQALADGRLERGDWCYAPRPFIGFLQGGGANKQHVPEADGSSAERQSEANIRGRAGLLRLLRFVRSLPGCEGATVNHMAPYTTVREGTRIVGETTITEADYRAGRLFDDALAYSFYFIDIHELEGVRVEHLLGGVVPTLPLSALTPNGTERLLSAGRTISADRVAFSGLRVQASCMAMGQMAGAAAALGARTGVPSRSVPLDDIRALLREHGALVPAPEASATP